MLRRTGELVRRVPRFRARDAVQAVELAPDRRRAFVSVFVPEQPPNLYEVDLATGAKRRVESAISPALSPDRTRLAYVSTELRVDIDHRTALVVRELRSGRTRSISLGPEVVVGTPPELVINWSPDGRHVAIFDDSRIRLVDVERAKDVVSQPSVPQLSGLAPVFLNAGTLVVLADCCIGDQHLVSVDIHSGKRSPFAVLSSPVEGIERLRPGLFLTVTSLNELALVSRGRTRVIARGITAATG